MERIELVLGFKTRCYLLKPAVSSNTHNVFGDSARIYQQRELHFRPFISYHYDIQTFGLDEFTIYVFFAADRFGPRENVAHKAGERICSMCSAWISTSSTLF